MTNESQTAKPFDLFICHVSKIDGPLARRIKRDLERLAGAGKPPLSMRIFLDHDDVPAASDLTDAIRSTLDRSSYLLVLARPELQKSPWCKLEIENWQSIHPGKLPLLAQSGGSDLWFDKTQVSFQSASERLPKALANAFAAEPSWVDLRAGHTGDDWWIHLARIASPIVGHSPQDVFSAHAAGVRRQLHKTRWLLATLFLLAVGVVIGFLYYLHAQSMELERFAIASLQQGTESVFRGNLSEGLPYVEQAARTERYSRRARLFLNNFLRAEDRWQPSLQFQLPDAPIAAFRVGADLGQVVVTDTKGRTFRSNQTSALELLAEMRTDVLLSPDRNRILLEAETDLKLCSWSGPCNPIPVSDFRHAAVSNHHMLVATSADVIVFGLPDLTERRCLLDEEMHPLDRVAVIDNASFLLVSGDQAWRVMAADCAASEVEGGWNTVATVFGAPGAQVVVTTDPGGMEEPNRVAVETDCGLAFDQEGVDFHDVVLDRDCTVLAITLDDTVVTVSRSIDHETGASMTLAAPFDRYAKLQFAGDTLMLTSSDRVQFVRDNFSGEKWLPIRPDAPIDSAWAIDDRHVYVLTSDGVLQLWTRISATDAIETQALPDSFLDAESGIVGNPKRARASGFGKWTITLADHAEKGPFIHDSDPNDLERLCEATRFTLCPYPSAAVDPQGKRLLTAVSNEPTRLWNVDDGTFRTLEFGLEYIRSVHLSDRGDSYLARGSTYYRSESEEISIIHGTAVRRYSLRHREWLADVSSDLQSGITVRKGQATWVSFDETLERRVVKAPFGIGCGKILSSDLFYLASNEDEVMLFDTHSPTPLTPVMIAANPDGEFCPNVKLEPSQKYHDGFALGRIAIQASGDKVWRIFEFEQQFTNLE